MKISLLIFKLEAIRETEGDIEVEFPNGQLLKNVNVVTRDIVEDRERQAEISKPHAGGKTK